MTVTKTWPGFRWPDSATAFQNDLRGKYDVVVMYDFSRDLDEKGKKNLRDFVESGKGIVVLHHALLNYQKWNWWYQDVVGGSYRLAREGDIPSSTVKNDQNIFVTPAGPHPITAGIGPFHIVDETYGRMWISPQVRPLLTTDNPNSSHVRGMDRSAGGLEGRCDPAWPWPYGVWPPVLSGPGAQRHPVGRGTDQVTAACPRPGQCWHSFAVLDCITTIKEDHHETGTLHDHLPGALVSRRGLALAADVIKKAKEYGYDGIEIDGKRPHGSPLDWSAARCRELRRLADDEGIDIFAVAANNDFSNPVPEVREAQICYVRDMIGMTSDLGAKTLRVFLAWWGVTRHPQLATYDIAEGLWPIVHEKFTTEEIWGWCRDALVECARYAGDAGITLALQNHRPLDQRSSRPDADGQRSGFAAPESQPGRSAHG